METKFLKYIRNNSSSKTQLPVIHSTAGRNFLGCINEQKLKATPCPVFSENLLYFFYGRPAYKSSKNGQTPEYWPVCFICKPDIIKRVKKIYPFDTGAYVNKRYDEIFKGKFTLDDYQIEKFPEDIYNLIETFFGDNHSYYRGKLKNIDIPESEEEVQSYYELVKTIVLNCDDRKYSIEIQTDEDIDIPNNVIAIICAEDSIDVRDINKLETLGVKKIIQYAPYNGLDSLFYYTDIYRRVEDFLSENDYF